MLDDDIKSVKEFSESLSKTLSGRQPKYSNAEKELCQDQKKLIDSHVESCQICKASMESYKNNFNIPMTPPCDDFIKQLKDHIEACPICNEANRKWNVDSIPVDNKFRKGVSILSKLNKMIGEKK